MVSRVTYRPFEEDDFEAIAAILQEAWHAEVPTPEYGFLEACNDPLLLALHLRVLASRPYRRQALRDRAGVPERLARARP